MQLTSTAFLSGDSIPPNYTCKGEGVSPPLTVSNIPSSAKSLALIVHDPDAPGHDFCHWVLWNIFPENNTIAIGQTPEGAQQGMNDFGKLGYGAPCPPSGTHRYVFELYALDTMLALPTGAGRIQLMAVMQGRMVASASLMGTVAAG